MSSEITAMCADFSVPISPVAADLLLFVLLFSFSPFPAMTKSAFLTSLCALRRMKNQNNPNKASSTTTTGTTMAGISVLRFDEDFSAADDVAAALPEESREVDEEDCASAAVKEASPAESVMVATTSPVVVINPTPPVTL